MKILQELTTLIQEEDERLKQLRDERDMIRDNLHKARAAEEPNQKEIAKLEKEESRIKKAIEAYKRRSFQGYQVNENKSTFRRVK